MNTRHPDQRLGSPRFSNTPPHPPSSPGLANVITFAYLGRVHMSLYTIGCTLSAATTLQIPQLLKMCMDFLLAELNLTTCVYVWNIAAAYGLLPVRDAARRFVLDNFVPFSETALFNQLTLEQISAFLRDDSLVLPSEVVAFQVRVHRESEIRAMMSLGSGTSPGVPRFIVLLSN